MKELGSVNPEWKIQNPFPPSAGMWVMGGGTLRIHCKKRPRWLTRVMTKWLLEWEWEETK